MVQENQVQVQRVRKCSTCKQVKPISEFYGKDYRCKDCHKIKRKAFYDAVLKVPDGIFRKGEQWYNHQGKRTTIYWTGNMLSLIKRYYPTTKNAELADLLGVSERTVVRKARELGLIKNPEWQANMSRHNGFFGGSRCWKQIN